MILPLMMRARDVARMAADNTLANNIRMSGLDREIKSAQAELDQAMSAARLAKHNLDKAAARAQATALRAQGVMKEDDYFSGEDAPPGRKNQNER